jgi:hypothetical protein
MTSLASRFPKPVRRRLGRIKRTLTGTAATGSHGGTSAAPTAASRLQLRRDFVFRTADPAGTILEVGPAHNPILPKRDGFHTRNVDYLDRDGLVEKYREFKQYSPDDIEDVDYVIPAGSAMSQVIRDRFDLVLASHVLEHSISLIDFLDDCTKLLAPGGVLSLVIPDHRYTFDRFRERSSIGRVIDASITRPSVHTAGTLTEFSLFRVTHRGRTSWPAGHTGKYRFVHDLAAATENAQRARGETYIDVHNWVFSPNHLRLLLHDLASLGLISVREAAFQDTIGHEFFLNLTVDGPGSGLTREELVARADAEQRTMDVPVFERPSAAVRDLPHAAGAVAVIDPAEHEG